jgi:hypothetical protein
VLHNEQDAPNNLRKVGTLLNYQECKLYMGCLVRYDRDLVNEKLMKIMLPESKKSQVAIALHNTFGHGSVSRLLNSSKRLFVIKNIHVQISTLCSNCEECTRLKKYKPTAREMKNFDEETLNVERIGMQILGDEIYRTLPSLMLPTINTRNKVVESKSVKIFFASEFLTRFAVSVLIQNNLNSEKLKEILYEVKNKLAATEPDDAYMTVRMDSVSSHAALVDNLDISNWGIKICLLEKNTGSKNRLAPLDGRIAIFSQHLNLELSRQGISKEVAVAEATKKYNFTIGGEGLRPTELFHGRYVHGKPFLVNIENLQKASILLRRCVQKSIELKRGKKRRIRLMHFIPFSEQMKYTDRNNMPLKLGDIIMIDEGGFQKENYRPMYKIASTTEIRSGIDWYTGLISCYKMDLKN